MALEETPGKEKGRPIEEKTNPESGKGSRPPLGAGPDLDIRPKIDQRATIRDENKIKTKPK